MLGGFFGSDDTVDEQEGSGDQTQRQQPPRQSRSEKAGEPQGNPAGGVQKESPTYQKSNTSGFDPGDVGIDDYQPTFDPSTSQGQMGKEVLIQGTDDAPYAGEWVRNMFEGAYNNPDQATWIGYKSNPQDGLREIPIEHNAWFRHASVFGTTGYGKTTFLKNLMTQWAYAGYGFCFIDPKGDGVVDLMQELPEHRLDDVIWIDPAPEDSERVVGVNFLQPGTEGSDAEMAAEKESIIDDLENIIKNESYWGPRMSSVFSTLARGMIESDKNYTLLDMYQVLVDEEYREMFVEDVDDPLVQKYARVIAEEMDQSDLDALVRRLKRLVNNNITREIISHKKSSFRIRDAVENGKIIFIKNDQDNADAKQMIATGMMRRIWAAIKARKEIDKSERKPYFLVVDEFDDVVTENADVDKMLSKARSFRLSVTLCNQQPSQLPQDIQQAIMGNCDNLLAFNPNNPADARLIMKKFGDYKASDLTNLGRFKMFTRIMVNNEQSPPFITQTFADYPPLRTREEAFKKIDESLEEYGTDRLDPKQIAQDVVLSMEDNEAGADREAETAGSAAQELADEHGDTVSDDDDSIDISERDVLESVYALELRENTRGEFLPVDAVEDELERRLNEEIYQSVSSEAIEKLNESPAVEQERRDNELMIRLTPEGRKQVVDINSGKVATGGGQEHRYVLKRSFEAFTMAGFKVTIPEQEGKEQPDGRAEIPMDMSASSPQEMKAKMEKLREEHPVKAEITDGTPINIEAETSTIKKPKQTLTNLRKAIEANRKCVFVVKDMESKTGDIASHARKGAGILLAPKFVAEKDREGNRRFYNKSSTTEVEQGVYAVRDRDTGRSVEWWETPNDEMQLRDKKSGELIQHFDSKQQALTPTKEDVPAYYHYDQAKGAFIVHVNKTGERKRRVYTDKDQFQDDWAVIREPFIPEEEFPREPRENDWMIVVMPDDDKDRPPLKYEPRITTDGNITGELTELIPRDQLNTDITTVSPNETTEQQDSESETPAEEPAQSSQESQKDNTEAEDEDNDDPFEVDTDSLVIPDEVSDSGEQTTSNEKTESNESNESTEATKTTETTKTTNTSTDTTEEAEIINPFSSPNDDNETNESTDSNNSEVPEAEDDSTDSDSNETSELDEVTNPNDTTEVSENTNRNDPHDDPDDEATEPDIGQKVSTDMIEFSESNESTDSPTTDAQENVEQPTHGGEATETTEPVESAENDTGIEMNEKSEDTDIGDKEGIEDEQGRESATSDANAIEETQVGDEDDNDSGVKREFKTIYDSFSQTTHLLDEDRSEPGDVFALCSDGVHTPLSEAEVTTDLDNVDNLCKGCRQRC